MTILRYKVNPLLKADNKPPETLDYLEFNFRGVAFRAYGILHGVTGGLNRDYREFVKNSIRSVDGIKLAEKGMKQLYRNCDITQELDDWLVLRPIDCLVMGFQLIADPRCLWMITVDALREKYRKSDAFITNKRKNISDLGESPYFHYLDEQERREIAGFLPPQHSISNDLKSMSHWYSSIIPKPRHKNIEHPQWRRLLLLERVMHIPCRSIHMLYYALAFAKKHGHKKVNLFVGETHNTDMQFIASHSDKFINTLNEQQKKVMNKLITRGTKYGQHSSIIEKTSYLLNKTSYFSMLLLGALLPVTFYLFMSKYLF